MKIVKCKECGKRFQAYDENLSNYPDCRTHIREFFFRNPEFLSKQIEKVEGYFTTKERRDMAMGLRGA